MADYRDTISEGSWADRGAIYFDAEAYRLTADTDDTAAIQRAISKADTAGRGTVRLSSGRVSTVGQLEIPSGVVLQIPESAVLLAKPGATFPLITLVDSPVEAGVTGGGIIDFNGQGDGSLDAYGPVHSGIFVSGEIGRAHV